MKALLITYYWPPAGGSGVQRWLKFVKYLPEFGIDPVVYTVQNANYALTDESLNEEVPSEIEVLKEPIWEPNDFLSKFSNKEKQVSAGFLSSKPSFIGRQLQYIRANYFIPDARKYWVRPSVKRLLRYMEEQSIDVVVTSGPPHSLHLIGKELKEKTGVKWIADFRDPWTNIDYFHTLPMTKKSKKKHYELENEVLKKADAVVVVGASMKKEFDDRNKNVHVITNGYDGEIVNDNNMLDKRFSISHIGMMNADRNPLILWRVLKELIQESSEFEKDLQVKLIGKCDKSIFESIQKEGLTDFVNFISYLPHKEVMQYQSTSQILLLSVNRVPSAKSIITGKVFEYLQSNRPIIGIGPLDGDLASIMKDSGNGIMIDFEDSKGLKESILACYNKYKSDQLKVRSKNIDRYHRRNLSEKLASLIKSI
ncbi:glycosyltransferase family 4 protein [Lutimonas zeaxanthinifaciens]|uniref:glycosyltransferase family 4 protein n=1 Tax=Lutimonas zeaxanthinifaciens TaxID=3060215 RepID=UPI00265D6002|nr:glycosyltransferase family 4 protein [Lutimonas sp. YSD2104]WKK65199.1 glycosyltransferase family 4 protein [Lutimonas sp. YSD2104]